MPPEMTEDTSNDLRARLVAVEHGKQDHSTRLTQLEQWRMAVELANAVRDEQFKGVRKDISDIKTTLSRIVWLILTGLIGGFIAFVINGGMRVP